MTTWLKKLLINMFNKLILCAIYLRYSLSTCIKKSRSIDLKFSSLSKNSGSALPVVLIFSSFALITVLVYLQHQTNAARREVSLAIPLQALLNSRSGLYKALQMIQSQNSPSNVEPVHDTRKKEFGMDLFDEELTDSSSLGLDGELKFDGSPFPLTVTPDDSLGTSEVAVKLKGSYCEIVSTGSFKSVKRKLTVKIGAGTPALPDTVLLLGNLDMIEGTFRGERGYRNDTQPSQIGLVDTVQDSGKVSPVASTKFPLFDQFLSAYTENVMFSDDTSSLMDIPLTVQSQRDLDKISDTVNGHLIIDGAFFDLKLKGPRKITVNGDLQVTGSVTADNIEFNVLGEIKLLDKSHLKNSSLFSMSRIFFGDDSRFHGDAIAMHSVVIYGRAQIEKNSSVLVAGGSAQSKDSLPGLDSRFFSVFISEQSIVDGVIIALKNPGGIKTEPDTKIKGILWAENNVCHQGSMEGLISAGRLIDCQDLGGTDQSEQTAPKNVLLGAIKPLKEITMYNLPFFLGRLKIVSWQEE